MNYGYACNALILNGEKDWSALADDFRTFVLSQDPVLSVEIASQILPAS